MAPTRHIINTNGNCALIFGSQLSIIPNPYGAAVFSPTAAQTSGYVLLPMATLSLLDGKRLTLNRVEIYVQEGKARINSIQFWAGGGQPISTHPGVIVDGKRTFPFSFNGPLLEGAVGVWLHITLEANARLVLGGAAIYLGESEFGLQEDPSKEVLETIPGGLPGV